MTFDAILAQVLDLLQHQGRVAYRALKVRFNLDDDYLEALKDELIYARRLAVDEDGGDRVQHESPVRALRQPRYVPAPEEARSAVEPERHVEAATRVRLCSPNTSGTVR